MRSPIGISGWLSTRSAYGGTMTSDHGMVDGQMARTLVLWDVDHTLIETRGVGGELFREGFEQATGHKLVHAAEVTGRTEPAIFRETAELSHHPVDRELLARYAQVLADRYRMRISELAARGRAIPGAAAAITALASAGGIVQSVLTGNLRAVAVIKLEAFGLTAWLDLDVGAYGSDDRTARTWSASPSDAPGTSTGPASTPTAPCLSGTRRPTLPLPATAAPASPQSPPTRAPSPSFATPGAAIVLPGLTKADAVAEAVTDAT